MHPTVYHTRIETPPHRRANEDEELERLMVQSRVFAPLTREVLERAKVGRGMRVLDLGCGAGDVSLLVAELVGPLGEVVGIDRSPAAVELAKRRAAFDGCANVRFCVADLHRVPAPWHYDAVVGRFVLMYQRDQVAAIQRITSYVRPGGLIVLHEFDIARGMDSLPVAPLWDRVVSLIRTTFVTAEIDFRAGLRLPLSFRDAGVEPQGTTYGARLMSGSGSEAFPVLAATLRSLLPVAERVGLVKPGAIEIETLADRLRDESIALGTVITTPMCVGVYGRTGGRADRVTGETLGRDDAA